MSEGTTSNVRDHCWRCKLETRDLYFLNGRPEPLCGPCMRLEIKAMTMPPKDYRIADIKITKSTTVTIRHLSDPERLQFPGEEMIGLDKDKTYRLLIFEVAPTDDLRIFWGRGE